MKKYCCYFLIIFLIIGLIFFFDYVKLKKELQIIKNRKDLTINSDQTQIVNNKNTDDENTKELKDILAEYLKKKDNSLLLQDTIRTKNRFIPDILPLKTDIVVSQKFSKEHPGIDLVAPLGTEVFASASGKLQIYENDNYFGNLIIIEHFNNYYSFYGHLDKIYAKSGNFVEKGELIGTVGSSGFSTGPHLHYSIRKDGEFIDPFLIIDTLNYEK